MNEKLPPHSHELLPTVYATTPSGKTTLEFVVVKFLVPSRVAALLPETKGFHTARSMDIGEDVSGKTWEQSLNDFPPLIHYFRQSIEEGCDTSIQMHIQKEQWIRLEILCEKLGISPGQRLLACATYSAEYEDRRIERMLSALPGPPEDE